MKGIVKQVDKHRLEDDKEHFAYQTIHEEMEKKITCD